MDYLLKEAGIVAWCGGIGVRDPPLTSLSYLVMSAKSQLLGLLGPLSQTL